MPHPGVQNCEICKWIERENEKEKPVYGLLYRIVECPKWFVHQYGGDEAFLGWLNLVPEDCVQQVLNLNEPTDEDTPKQMGKAIQKVELAMQRIWPEFFPEDILERVHTVSFMEGHFDTHDEGKTNTYYHLHIHIIPRSRMIGELIQRRVNHSTNYDAWNDHLIASGMTGKYKFRKYCRSDESVASFFSKLGGELELKAIDPKRSSPPSSAGSLQPQ